MPARSLLPKMTLSLAPRAAKKEARHASMPSAHAHAERPRAEGPSKRHDEPDDGKKEGKDRHAADAFDPLDPASRKVAQIAPPMTLSAVAPATNEVAARARVSMEDLLPQLVRRIAWAGDRRKGTVQLEIGAGRHEGTTVTVHADDGRVRVELRGKDGAPVDDLRERLDARLRRHGLDVESVT
jgi:hypothetical protein